MNTSNVPVQVSGLTGVVAIAESFEHSLALKSDGTAWGWGTNGYGELGNGSPQLSGFVQTPVMATVHNVVAIAAGASHSLWLRSDGTVWAVGYGGDGALGTGNFNDSTTPVRVPSLSGVSSIAAGHSHSLAIKSR